MIAPYTATSTEQLSLQRGQLVKIRKKTTTGWWEGELQVTNEEYIKNVYSYLLLLNGRQKDKNVKLVGFQHLMSNLLVMLVEQIHLLQKVINHQCLLLLQQPHQTILQVMQQLISFV